MAFYTVQSNVEIEKNRTNQTCRISMRKSNGDLGFVHDLEFLGACYISINHPKYLCRIFYWLLHLTPGLGS